MSAQPTPTESSLTLRVNGQERAVTVPAARTLSRVLREEWQLTGTKVGCEAGDCGACTVLLDGEQVCACLVSVGQCLGREVLTVEGLAADAGLNDACTRLQAAFVDHGAAQCGICTPGMLMAAADTLTRHPEPTEAQVLDGLGGVLCRCTGYRKIVEAVMAAARPASAGAAVAEADPAAGAAVGARLPRLDAWPKVRGEILFGADEAPADALWLRVLRSPHPRACFRLGDLDAFVARAGLAGVITASDIPNNRFAIFPDLRDQPALAEGAVRFRGEAVVGLVGTAQALTALDLREVPVDWTPEPAMDSIERALSPGAVAVQERWPDNVLCRGRVVHGAVDEAFAQAASVFSAQCRTGHVEHAYIEPEAGWARWGEDGRVTIFACTQTPYMDRDEIAWMFGLEPSGVRILPSAVGGGFGGKLDLSVQPLLVAAARKFGRAVRMVYSRAESMASSTKRHPAQMQARLALDAQGNLAAYDFNGDFNTGAYASWGPTVANRVPIHASGPYRIAHVRALTRAVLTNDSVCGAFRGFGVPQSTLINESLMDQAAAARGEDPLEFRWRHALRAGDTTCTGQVLSASVGLQACLEALRPAWQQTRARLAAERPALPAHLRRGVGVACMWYGIGNTVIANPSDMTVGLRANGRFMLYNGAVDIGQGTYTIMPQLCADGVGVPVALFDQIFADTDLTRDAGKSSASRQTFVSGNAAQGAGRALRARLLELLGVPAEEHARARLEVDGSRLSAQVGGRLCTLDLSALPVDANGDVATGSGHFNPPTVPLDGDGQGVPYATYGFAAQFAEVEVDVGLGTVRVLALHAAHDVGRAVNPTQVEGQIHGGIAQGLGLALMEEYVNGRTDNLHDYLIPTAGDIPPITVHLIEDPEPLGPQGAKGVGEPALVATAPAILNAIHDATGLRLTRVPATPDRVRAAWRAQGESR